MKKIGHLSILLIALLAVFSCKKDKNTDLLVGKWDLDSMRFELFENDVLSESESSTDEFDYLEFTSSGNFYVYDSGTRVEDAEWRRNGDILTLIYGVNDEEDLTIVTLTNTKLVVKIEDTYQQWREVITVYLTRRN